jgi:predicted dehydrogenase
MTASSRLTIGIIGAGGIATGVHLPALSALDEVDVRAVCDFYPGRAEAAARTFGIPQVYTSYHQMLREAEVDAVYVLVPPDGLFRGASDCLLAGKHVFMEKPMGITAYQARTLRDLALAQRRVLHVGYNRRYIPLVTAVAARMRELTVINHIEGRFYKNSSPAFYGGCASAFTCDVIHVIDLVRYIARGVMAKNASGEDAGAAASGAAPGLPSEAEVWNAGTLAARIEGGAGAAATTTEAATTLTKAYTIEEKNPETGVGEAWYSAFEFKGGVSGVVRANYRTGGRVHQFELHGEGASAYIDLGFGGAGCSGKILHTIVPGGQSLSAAGAGKQEVIDFDGPTLAGSDRYEVYYGYSLEDQLFAHTVLSNPSGTDRARAVEDCASMELVEALLAARV